MKKMSGNASTALPVNEDQESDWEYEYSQTETEVILPFQEWQSRAKANDEIELLCHPRSFLCITALPSPEEEETSLSSTNSAIGTCRLT